MASKWKQSVEPVRSGEAVQASIVGRPDMALTDRTGYLKDRLDAAALGRAVFDTDATVAADVLEGEAVYWNADSQQYERALAGVESDAATGTLVPSSAADCVGLVYLKKSSTQADIVLAGIVKLPALTNAIAGEITAGRYYLSASDAGKLVKQRPPATVAVCLVQGAKDNCADDPWVIVNPQMRDFLEDHIHYRFELTCRPAGQHDPAEAFSAGRHTITAPDADLLGWLPANHASFAGRAPAGAAFGYNLAQHAQLDQVWPPVPVSAVALLWDKGQGRVGATEVPLGTQGLVVCDNYGIWWMSDCYGDVPWPATYDTAESSSSSLAESSSSSAVVPECPREEAMRLSLVYLRMVFATDRSVVTSLQPAEGSPITIRNCQGETAQTGDLQLGLDLEYLIDPAEALGGIVIKELVDGFKFRQGYVCEGLLVGDDSVTLSATRTRLLDPEDENSATVYQGLVTLQANLEPTDRELSPQVVRLADAVERLYKDIVFLGLPEARDSSVRLRFVVPPAGLPTSPTMQLRVVLFGRTTATLPLLTVSYRRLPRPSPAAVALPTADTNLTFASNVSITAETMLEIQSEAFAIAAGDTVFVTIARAADAGYAGEVGLIRTGGVLLGG